MGDCVFVGFRANRNLQKQHALQCFMIRAGRVFGDMPADCGHSFQFFAAFRICFLQMEV